MRRAARRLTTTTLSLLCASAVPALAQVPPPPSFSGVYEQVCSDITGAFGPCSDELFRRNILPGPVRLSLEDVRYEPTVPNAPNRDQVVVKGVWSLPVSVRDMRPRMPNGQCTFPEKALVPTYYTYDVEGAFTVVKGANRFVLPPSMALRATLRDGSNLGPAWKLIDLTALGFGDLRTIGVIGTDGENQLIDLDTNGTAYPVEPCMGASLQVGQRWRRIGTFTRKGAVGAVTGTLSLLDNPPLHDDRVLEGTVKLYEQVGSYRDPLPGESETEYEVFLETLRGRLVQEVKLGPADEGRFTFSDAPFVEYSASGIASFVLYMVEITGAAGEQNVLDAEGNPVLGPGDVPETRPLEVQRDRIFNVIPENPVDLVLAPFAATAIKRDLATQLKALSELHYEPIESQVITYLDGLGELTDEQREGIERAIWAERGVRDATVLARTIYQLLGQGLTEAISVVIDALGNRLATTKKFADARRQAKGFDESSTFLDGYAAEFGETAVTAQLRESVRESLQKLRKEHGDSIRTAEYSRFFKGLEDNLVKTLGLLIDQQLIGQPEKDEQKEQAVKIVRIVFRSVLDFLDFQTVQGAARLPSKFVLQLLARAITSELMEGSAGLGISFAEERAADLDHARERMISWPTADRDGFKADRKRALAELLELNRSASRSIASTQYSLDASSALEQTQGAIGIVGLVPAAKPFTEATEVVLQAGKLLNDINAVVDPLYQIIAVLPPRSRAVVYEIMGEPDTPQLRSEILQAYRPRTLPRVAANAGLVAEVTAARNALVSAIGGVQQALNGDRIIEAVDLMVGDDQTRGLTDEISDFERTLALYLRYATAIQNPNTIVQPLLDQLSDRSIEAFVVGNFAPIAVSTFAHDVFDGELGGPGDADYLIARASVSALLTDLSAAVSGASSIANAFSSNSGASQFAPAVKIAALTVDSQATGDSRVSESPETFTITATVRNVSALAVVGVSALLEVAPDESPISVSGPAELAIGALSADDATPGGADEAEVSWEVVYTGDLTLDIGGYLDASLLENGGAPTGFEGDRVRTQLSKSPGAEDADLDGMPLAFETQAGLDPLVDDANGDADFDGLTNFEEMRMGTAPDLQDTDADGIEDFDEALGTSGLATDPLDADTDGDGVLDGADGAPTDPLSSLASLVVLAEGEPEVAVDRRVVVLSPSIGFESIVVSNAGSGRLLWSAGATNPDLVVENASVRGLSDAGETLFVSARESIDVASLPATVSRVRVVDMVGADKDFQEILVVVGQDAGDVFCGHATDNSVGRSSTATDALAALSTAVGSGQCDLCRCDVDLSGTVSATDALAILRVAVGLGGALSCQACTF